MGGGIRRVRFQLDGQREHWEKLELGVGVDLKDKLET